MEPTHLDHFVGRRGVYIENGDFYVVRVTSTTFDHQRMIAHIEIVSDLVCHYRENRFALEPCPFGESWEISQEWSMFFFEDDCWDGSIRAGFRLIFNEEVIKKFEREDLSWIEDFF